MARNFSEKAPNAKMVASKAANAGMAIHRHLSQKFTVREMLSRNAWSEFSKKLAFVG